MSKLSTVRGFLKDALITKEQFRSLKPGSRLQVFRRGKWSTATVVSISETGHTILQYYGGSTRAWSRSHICKYYSIIKP